MLSHMVLSLQADSSRTCLLPSLRLCLSVSLPTPSPFSACECEHWNQQLPDLKKEAMRRVGMMS